uniref:Uncharacterized protein n=1 Tax=Candidozyma auris TaxID=498019 RepID=A0A0L0P1G3_CANAR
MIIAQEDTFGYNTIKDIKSITNSWSSFLASGPLGLGAKNKKRDPPSSAIVERAQGSGLERRSLQ